MEEFQAMLEKSLQPLHSKMDEMKNQIDSTIAAIKISEEAISIAKEAKEVANKNKEDIELKEIKIKAIEKNIKTNTKMIEDITNTLDDNIEVMEKKRDANIERMIGEKIENIMKDERNKENDWVDIMNEQFRKDEMEERIKKVENHMTRLISESEARTRKDAEEVAREISVDEGIGEKVKENILTWPEICRRANINHEVQKVLRKKKENENEEEGKKEENNDSPVIRMLRDGRRRMGLYPVDRTHIDNNSTSENLNEKQYNEKRMEAAKEFLDKELKLDEVINIKQTKWNEKASILWIETSSEEEIFQIFSQAAETRNSEVRVINYFPGEIYGRMKELDTLCKKEKEVDPTFKYQIRCGYDDLTLRVKTGGAINWVEKPLNTFGPLNDFKLVFYRGNKSSEEKSPAKGRRGKRIRSEEKSPVRPLKKHNTEICSPTAAANTPTSVAASTPGISKKKLM